jgi:UDP-N-acetylmuramoylalanine--D-glutamate ligase
MATGISSRIWWFSRKHPVELGVYVQDEQIYAKLPGQKPFPILPVHENALRGSFNLENALAATTICLAAGVPLEAIQETLRTFQGVEHRLEYVQTIHGVKYYNDSKATNAQAATMALESFTEPVIWIAGGLDRGTSFKEMVPVMKERVKALITYGQTKEIFALRAQEAGITQIHRVKDVQEAVQTAFHIAESGDVVLLSPACASWDQYTSFEQRGSIFKQAVHSLQI